MGLDGWVATGLAEELVLITMILIFRFVVLVFHLASLERSSNWWGEA